MQPEYYEVFFDCWRGCRNLLNEESEVAVQADAGFLDLLVDILVGNFIYFISFPLSFFAMSSRSLLETGALGPKASHSY